VYGSHISAIAEANAYQYQKSIDGCHERRVDAFLMNFFIKLLFKF